MRKLLVTIMLLLTSTVFFAQDDETTIYKHRKIFTEVRYYSNTISAGNGLTYQGFNIGYQGVGALKLKGEKHPNIKHGMELYFEINMDTGTVLDQSLPAPPQIFNGRASYVFGYEHQLSDRLMLFGSIKPSLAYTGLFSDEEGVSTESNFDFVGLISGEVRYFFTEKFGLAADIFTSFEGGYGVNLGIAWRK